MWLSTAVSIERKASVRTVSTPLSFPHGKESAVDGRKKGWQRGSFESPPLQTPLKRPRRGLWPPSLDFPRGLVRAEFIFGFTKRDADASLLNRRGSRNTLRQGRADRGVRPYKPLDSGNASNFIHPIFNRRKRSDSHSIACAWKPDWTAARRAFGRRTV